MILNLISLQAQAAGGSGLSSIFMIVILIAIFYFMMIRPQKKRQNEIKKFREGLKSGDHVITAGGLHGKVDSVKDNHFIVDLGNNIKVKVSKESVYPSAEAANDPAVANVEKK
ncbi:MAG: preprotein translocase subunit YajC [Bacteroidales bacterium]|nr:preprotein translocase subunit YajC [Bacteroidales bacterium]MCD8394929.1 preprotein translocase subunit YajC [Bacteroidales bacterium]